MGSLVSGVRSSPSGLGARFVVLGPVGLLFSRVGVREGHEIGLTKWRGLRLLGRHRSLKPWGMG